MADEKKRVDFNAPSALVERADAVADVLDVSRTQLLVDALRDELDAVADDDAFRRRLQQAYYDGDAGYDVVESVLGTEEAMRLRLLKRSIDREPPEPVLRDGSPDDAFYDGDRPRWMPDDGASVGDADDGAGAEPAP
jgi:predicted transcriptional regulator